MRIEVGAAYAMGVLLPLAEIARRRTNFTPVASYVDDLIAGALLLVAARAVSIGARSGDAMLVAAWAILCGGLYYSFFGQLNAGSGTDISGLANETVVAIKGVAYVIALSALVLAIRSAGDRRNAVR